MKFLNKVLFVAVLSVGLYSCSNKEAEPQVEEVKRTEVEAVVIDSLPSGDTVRIANLTGFILGDGSASGHHNVTIFDSISQVNQLHYAVFRLIKANGTATATVLKTIVLLSNTARVSLNTANEIVIAVEEPNKHWVGSIDVGFGMDFDMKITSYNPWNDGKAAIVGGEDPRAGVVGYRGDLSSFRLTAGTNHSVRISQPTQGGK